MNVPARAVGMPYFSMNCWENTLEDSNWAAFWFGPQMRSPCCWNKSTMPSASGLSGPDDGEVGLLLLGEGEQRGQIFRAEVDAFDRGAVPGQPFLRDAGVARGAPQLRDVRRLRQLPNQGVFASARADDQNLHRRRLNQEPAGAQKQIATFLLDICPGSCKRNCSLTNEHYQSTMKTGFRIALAVGFGVALLQLTAAAQDKPAATNAATNAPKLSPEEQKENRSYAIGMNIGNSIKRGGVELDVDVLAGAMKDVMAGQRSEADGPAGAGGHQRSYQTESRAKQEEVRKQTAEKNKKEGEAFLAENKNKPGVKTHTVKLPGRHHGRNAIQGHHRRHRRNRPRATTRCMVNYRGTLINGKEFDSSAKRGASRPSSRSTGLCAAGPRRCR